MISYINSVDGSTTQCTIVIWRNESDRDNFANESLVQSTNTARIAHNNNNNIIHNFVTIQSILEQIQS